MSDDPKAWWAALLATDGIIRETWSAVVFLRDPHDSVPLLNAEGSGSSWEWRYCHGQWVAGPESGPGPCLEASEHGWRIGEPNDPSHGRDGGNTGSLAGNIEAATDAEHTRGRGRKGETMDDDNNLLGKTVEWTSQSSGYRKTKRGRVIYDGKPLKCSPYEWRDLLVKEGLPEELINSSGRFKHSANHRADYLASDGLIVLVERTNKKGQPMTPWTYAPRRKSLRIIEEV